MTQATPFDHTDRDTALLDAGEYLDWAAATLESFRSGGGCDVPCGECRACCRAGYFIPVRHDEWDARRAIPAGLLVTAPGLHGIEDAVLATRRRGDCALLVEGRCTVYAHRPQACRDYDCRIFTAAGVTTGIAAIDARARRWRFRHRDGRSRQAHEATRYAARLMMEHASAFPDARVPPDASGIAIAALKAHAALMDTLDHPLPPVHAALRIVSACRAFDAHVARAI